VALWANFQGSTKQVAFTATGWREVSLKRVNELMYVGELRPGQVTATGDRYPAILPASWEQEYPQIGPPIT
jgi:hypothetical protein